MSETKTLEWLYAQSDVPLNLKQKSFLKHFIESKGHAVLNGLAGSGKSTVMFLLKIWYADEIIFMGSTGIASQNLPNGIGIGTAFAYLSLPTKPSTPLNYTKVSDKCSNLFAKSDKVKIIVIDEGYFLNSDSLDMIWRRIERFNKRTGSRKSRNIRLLLVGDCCQSITIANKELKQELATRWGSHLIFRSSVWKRFNFTHYVFDQVMRQDDKVFKECLNVLRYNQVHRIDKCLSWINKRVVESYDPEKVIVLAATNKTVDMINNHILSLNPNIKVKFTPTIKGKFDIKDTLVREQGVTLCEGLKVISIYNDPEGRWSNGSTGVITFVETDGAYVRFNHSGEEHFVGINRWENKEVYTETVVDETGEIKSELKEKLVGSLECIGLLQADALSIMKSQGLTIKDPYIIDVEDSWLYTSPKLEDFGTNAVYLALSRGTDINNIGLMRPITRKHIKCCQESINFWHDCCAASVI